MTKIKMLENFNKNSEVPIKKSTFFLDLVVLETSRDFLNGKLTAETIQERKKKKYWRKIFSSGVDFLIEDMSDKTKSKGPGKTEEVKNPTTFGLEEAIEVFKGIAGGLFQWGVENSELKKQVKALEEKTSKLEKNFSELQEKFNKLVDAYNGLVKNLGDNFRVIKKKK